MTKLLISNTEQVQPDSRNDTLIKLFGRRPDNPDQREEITVYGFDPYFYAREPEVESQEDFLLAQDSIARIEYGDYEAFEGDDLAKIYTPYPQDVRAARQFFDDHWSADVPFTDRFRIDTGMRALIEVPDDSTSVHWREIEPVEAGSSDANPGGSGVEPRIVTLDIEVDDRGDAFPTDGDERILSIVAHDSYDDNVIAWVDGEKRPVDEMFPNGAPDNIDELCVAIDEESMLGMFSKWFRGKDPDLITGWNVDDFDAPYLIARMETVGVDPDRLSPLGWSGTSQRGDPRIKGRTVYDMLTVYKQNSRTELRSYSLDYVAEQELGEAKVEFDGGYYDLYQDDPETFIEYNAKDVTLVVDINREAGVVKFRDILRREVGVDFEDSYYNKDFVDMMCRRKLKELGKVGPSRPAYGEAPDSDYDGAFVFDAYEGVAENVVGIDLASLYPYTMAMLNASPETKYEPPSLAEKSVEGREFPEHCEADNGQYFRLDKPGLFKQLVDEAISLKSEYKRLRNNASTEEEYEKYAERYAVAKTITNSLYGVTGWERFFLYDEDVAEAVTLTGQAVIKRTAEYVEETGYDVIYGDTDSCYISFPGEWDRERCLNTARELCTDLNETVYPEMAADHGIPAEDNLWEIEAEAYMTRYFQAGKKKRYAYVATWKDGHEIEDPSPNITGFSSKRSDTSALTVETEQRVLEAILDGREGAVGEIVYDAAQQITERNPDWDRIGIPGGFGQRLAEYPRSSDGDFPKQAHPRAAYNSNAILGTDIGFGDKPKRVYIKPHWFDEVGRNVEVLAFTTPSDLDPVADEIAIDVPRMVSTVIENPLRRILNAVDVEPSAAVRGQEQTDLGAFGD